MSGYDWLTLLELASKVRLRAWNTCNSRPIRRRHTGASANQTEWNWLLGRWCNGLLDFLGFTRGPAHHLCKWLIFNQFQMSHLWWPLIVTQTWDILTEKLVVEWQMQCMHEHWRTSFLSICKSSHQANHLEYRFYLLRLFRWHVLNAVQVFMVWVTENWYLWITQNLSTFEDEEYNHET